MVVKVLPARGRKRGTMTSVALTTALAVLVAASLVGSAQAKYSCTSDSQCAYKGCRAGEVSASSPNMR